MITWTLLPSWNTKPTWRPCPIFWESLCRQKRACVTKDKILVWGYYTPSLRVHLDLDKVESKTRLYRGVSVYIVDFPLRCFIDSIFKVFWPLKPSHSWTFVISMTEVVMANYESVCQYWDALLKSLSFSPPNLFTSVSN